MICIHILLSDKQVKRVTLSGHALFDDYGKDIVCAGVSAILTTTINGILTLQSDALTYQKKKDLFRLDVSSTDEITQKLIRNMILLFQELEGQYPKNIKVESEEET